MAKDRVPPNPPPSPQHQPDRLYVSIAKGSKRATQMLPDYKEFRLGQGDPLLKATMKHDFEMATGSPRSKKKLQQKLDDSGDIHLIQNLSPVRGHAVNDVVHIDKDTAVSIPCVPLNDFEDSGEERDRVTEPKKPSGMNDVVHLPSGMAVSVPVVPAGLGEEKQENREHSVNGVVRIGGVTELKKPSGMSDVVHLPSGTPVSVPLVPAGLQEAKEDNPEFVSALPDHGSPLSGLGMSDIVHVGKHTVVSIPCIPHNSEEL